MEGLATLVIGATLHWTLPDSPATASFLTMEEKTFIKNRLEEDSGTSSGRVQTEEKFQWAYLKSSLLDWRIWFTVFIYWGNTYVSILSRLFQPIDQRNTDTHIHSVPSYAFTFTAPVIILQLGYTAAQAQLLTIPVYIVGMISTLTFSWIADKRQRRWPFIIIPYSIALIGFVGLMAVPRSLPGLTYAFLFCIPAGVFPAVITLVSWISNNLSPTWKRAIGIGMSLMMGNLGGAVGSNIYLAREAPTYWTGYGVSVAFLANAILSTLVLRYFWDRENKKRDKISEEEVRARYSEGRSSHIINLPLPQTHY